MPLTDLAARTATPRSKSYRLFDGGGLYLEVSPTSAKYWRWKFYFAGKEKRLAFGVYPEVTLKAARSKRDAARKLLADGVDPSAHRKAVKNSRETKAANSFEIVGREWYDRQRPIWSDVHSVKQKWMLEKNLFPWIGARSVADISPTELLSTLRRTESRGALETTKRVKQIAGQVFRYSVATGRAERDPSRSTARSLRL